MSKHQWIAAVARGHNGSVCLLKDGKIVFSIEEERLSRCKYDGGPLAALVKVLEYTDKLDYLVIAHTQDLDTAGRIDFTGDDVYTGLARKLGLIDRTFQGKGHPQVIDLSSTHHKLHAACAFYRSGFKEAAAVIVDGAGTFINLSSSDGSPQTFWEVESIFDCTEATPSAIGTNLPIRYKHLGTRDPIAGAYIPNAPATMFGDEGELECVISDRGGIVKAYEAVTQYCGWSPIEAGKTMGLFPYGKENKNIPPVFDHSSNVALTNRNLIVPTYPNGAVVQANLFTELASNTNTDITQDQNRRDMAYAIQTQSQEEVLALILKAVKITGKTNVVVSGGYGLNCVANYYYLKTLQSEGINLYVEPISNDAGTAIGAAFMMHHFISKTLPSSDSTLYLGPEYSYSEDEINRLASQYGGSITEGTPEEVVNLMTSKNIVAMFQGKSENGPRALGNRSLMFDPRFEDGKDFVNTIKRREYFRPFAGSILSDDVHDWFDLRGMKDSPHMMYAVNCKDGVADKIPSIIHVDGTCRIQTVTKDENKHYAAVIQAFKDKTDVPIIFNTSFNLGGEPLVETLEDALWTLQQSDIEYLYLPEYGKIIKVPNN